MGFGGLGFRGFGFRVQGLNSLKGVIQGIIKEKGSSRPTRPGGGKAAPCEPGLSSISLSPDEAGGRQGRTLRAGVLFFLMLPPCEPASQAPVQSFCTCFPHVAFIIRRNAYKGSSIKGDARILDYSSHVRV